MRKFHDHIACCLRVPLMAVMLLWALTLPGQEVKVYDLMLHGSLPGSRTVPVPVSKGTQTVQPQAVHAFQDARESTFVISGLQQWANQPLLLLFAFHLPSGKSLPVCHGTAVAVRLTSQLLAGSLQANAP